MPIDADKQRYFWLAANDPVTATEPEPATYADSIIDPAIDLAEYMGYFRAALQLVGTDPNRENNRGDFIYISGWWLGLLGGTYQRGRGFTAPGSGLGSAGPTVGDLDAFDLDPNAPVVRLIDELKKKAQAGVDVRVLGWVSFSLLSTAPVPIPLLGALINPIVANAIQAKDPGGLVSLNGQTMNSIKKLREEPNAIPKGGMLNVIGHSAGAVHIKGAVIGRKADAAGKTEAIAFTGGLDLVDDRWAEMEHKPNPGWAPLPTSPPLPRIPRWHDVQAVMEGRAAQAFYNHFRDMWNENLRREAKRFNFEGQKLPSYVPGTEAVPDRLIEESLIPNPDPKLCHVQSLRTIPKLNYRWYNCLPENDPVSYAPNGLFEIKAAWKKAILGAQRFIYIEDQMYWGKEIMEWVNQTIRNQPNLRVILAMSGQADPNDPAFDDAEYLHESINVGLLGIENPPNPTRELSAAQRNQIRIFRLWGEPVLTADGFTVNAVTPVNAAETRLKTDQVLPPDSAPVAEDALKGKNLYVTDGAATWEVTGNLAATVGNPLVVKVDPHGAPPANGSVLRIYTVYGLVVHSKVTLIDDTWAMIGSANVARRSLYTDWEHCVSFIDEGGDRVRRFQGRLWGEHFKIPNLHLVYSLDEELGGWDADPAWRTTANFPPMPTRPAGVLGPPYLQPVPMPLPNRPMSDKTRTSANEIRDVDSRDEWGGVCPPSQ